MKTKRHMDDLAPTLRAVFAADIDKLKAAIDADDDVNAKDWDGRTPLHYACIDKLDGFVRLLLDHGALVSHADKKGWTPLHFAAQNQNIEIARLLVDAGALVDAVDSNGNTPLFRAIFSSSGDGELITLLLQHGADKNHKNNYDVSPLDLANTIANYDVAQWLKPNDPVT